MTTRLSDLIIPSLFTPYSIQRTEEKSRLVQSGLISRDSFLDTFLAGEGSRITLPKYRDLANDAERISNDSSAAFDTADASVNAAGSGTSPERPPNPRKITTFSEEAVRLERNQSWSSMDINATLTGSDPMNAIGELVSDYWVRRLQVAFISTWRGVLADNIANDGGDYLNNISGLVFQDGVTNFSAEAFINTTLLLGDAMFDVTAMAVHSVVYARMQKNNLIDFIPDSEGRVIIPTFLGRQVIVDDAMPRPSTGVFDTWLFGPGQTIMGMGSPKVPTEVQRLPGAGNGSGQEVLYNRVSWAIHPRGHSFVGTGLPAGGPANTGTGGADLDEAASWNRVAPERKMVKFCCLRTREF